MAYQIYRIGERECVGGVDGDPPSAHTLSRDSMKPKPMLARRPLASPTRITRAAATEAFRSLWVGESPFDNNRPSLAAWWATHPHVFDFDDSPF